MEKKIQMFNKKMMIIAPLAIALTCLAVGRPAVAEDAAPDTDAVKTAIDTLYTNADTGLKNKDFKPFEVVETADFISKHKDGKVSTKAESDKAGEDLFAHLKSVGDASHTLDSIKVDGNAAVIVAGQNLKAVMTDPDGKDHDLVVSGKSQDTWVKTDDGWKIKSSETLETSMTMDGNAAAAN